jgi:hypothetical protein
VEQYLEFTQKFIKEILFIIEHQNVMYYPTNTHLKNKTICSGKMMAESICQTPQL